MTAELGGRQDHDRELMGGGGERGERERETGALTARLNGRQGHDLKNLLQGLVT